MAIYIYKIADGSLVSWCQNDTDPVASAQVLTAQGMTSIAGLPALGPTIAWDPTNKTTKAVAAPTPANVIATFDFIMAFTPTELAAIRASTNANVQQFFFALQVTQGVNLNSATLGNALNFLVLLLLLTVPRATAIMATLTSGAT